METQVRIAPNILERHPDYRAVVLYARHLVSGPSTVKSMEMLRDAIADASKKFAASPLQEHPHLAAWRRKYAGFGCNPRKALCSVEALLQRLLKKGLSPIHRIVDVYNAVSIAHVVPIGGEDLDCVEGDVVLRFANGNEVFVCNDKNGTTSTRPDAGEVVWVDDQGVTCRRWNWRQCSRTSLTEQSTSAYFVLEIVAPFGANELTAAAESLQAALEWISPGCEMQLKDVMHSPALSAPGDRVPETEQAACTIRQRID